MITVRVSALQFLLIAGIYVSSMSSCLGAMYGTPRVLQSIANENVVPGIGILAQGVCITSHWQFFLITHFHDFTVDFSVDQTKYRCMQ